MEPISDAEQEHDGHVSEQPESSSNSSECQNSVTDPFEALLKSSTDDEAEDVLCSIIRINGYPSDVISLINQERLFEIGLPDVKPQNVFDAETLITKVHFMMEYLREGSWNGLITIGPFLTTYTKSTELKELQIKNALRLSATLSHRLYHTHIWVMRYDSNRDHENDSAIQLKLMSPVMFAALTCKPNIVHSLMKYGTRFLDETDDLKVDADSVSMRVVCMRTLLSDIITELFENPEVWDSDALELKTDFSNLPERLRSKCLNFRLLLRCDPNPYVTTVKLASLIGPQLPPLPEMNILRDVYDSLFPDLGLGLFNPPQLQHMCRCVIRRRLHENWQLPDGISQLELSKILCDYVSLFDD